MKSMVAILVALVPLSGCMQGEPEPPFTPEERAYWTVQHHNVETLQAFIQSILSTMPTGKGDPRSSVRELRHFSASFVNHITKITSDSQQGIPPDLFKDYHNYVGNMNGVILVGATAMGRQINEFADRMERLLDRSPTQAEFKAAGDAILATFEKDADALLREYDPLYQTYYANYLKAVETINRRLAKRHTAGPETLASVLKASLVVSYQPYMIPVSVQLNNRGEIEFVGSMSIPTPIGVFSIGAEVQIQKSHTLIIVAKGKKWVYDMGDKPFVVDFCKLEGTLREMRYDGEKKCLTVAID